MSASHVGRSLAPDDTERRHSVTYARLSALIRVGQYAEFLGAQVQAAITENV